MESSTFDSIIPSRYISFTLPKPSNPSLNDYLHTDYIRIAILDSPLEPANPPLVAAMLVPQDRENDWIFSTEAGHFQLLSGAPAVSRLTLIGNDSSGDDFGVRSRRMSLRDNPDCLEKLEESLYPLLAAFLPKRNREMGNFGISFLRYEDNVISSVVLERVAGPVVGEMLVEDVEIEGPAREFRRRLRFKRMPNLVQSEIRIVPKESDSDLASLCLKKVNFQLDLRVLVHPYLPPMVASLSLLGGYLQKCLDSGIRPKALCIGVGGGALLGFLATQLGFEVMGVEVDEVVLRVAKQYFGLQQCELVQVSVGDGIEILKNIASNKSEYDLGAFLTCDLRRDCHGAKFDVIMVDLDPSDFRMGTGAPPLEFMQESIFLGAWSCLSGVGLLVLNVMPTERLAYENLIQRLKEVFVELHEIDTGNGENFVVIATMSGIDRSATVHENAFLTKLRSVTSGAFMDAIRKI